MDAYRLVIALLLRDTMQSRYKLVCTSQELGTSRFLYIFLYYVLLYLCPFRRYNVYLTPPWSVRFVINLEYFDMCFMQSWFVIAFQMCFLQILKIQNLFQCWEGAHYPHSRTTINGYYRRWIIFDYILISDTTFFFLF